MRYTNCSKCDKKHIPVNDTVKIDGDVYCSDCFAQNFTTKEQLKGKKIDQSYDPTVCGYCGTDQGYIELPVAGGRPVCDKCTAKQKNMIMPQWVKLFFVAIIAIVVFSIFWNWRFYRSWSLLKQSGVAMDSFDLKKAAALMKEASEKVPESNDLSSMSLFDDGLYLLSIDSTAKALIAFNKCKNDVPPEIGIDDLINKAKMGIGFDTKDYGMFLSASKEHLAVDSTAPESWASVASAYACIYADKGQDSVKMLSMQNLQKAKSIDDTTADMKQYYNMIEYRLYSRSIIKREDFTKKFPNGWTKN